MSFRTALSDRRLWVMAAYGFACGLPLPLSGFTLRQWMSEGGVTLGAIGLSAYIGLAYTLKFLWSPLLDQLRPPFARLGRRRGWLAAVQPLLTLACFMLALSDPTSAPVGAVAAAVGVAFLSASQDIVVDAWRIETFPPTLQGAAMATYVWGYRFAMLISGAGAISLATPLGWHGSLLCIAALSLLPLIVTLLAKEPPSLGAVTGPVTSFFDRFVGPLREFLSRPGAGAIILFVALYRLGEAMAGVMLPPLYRSLGFDRNAVAVANGPISLTSTLAGIALGGWLVARLGVGRALIMTGFGQMAAMFMYVSLAASAGEIHMLYATSLVEALSEGLADAAFITYLSGLCAPAFTATQFALLTSLAAVPSRTVSGLSGFIAAQTGWVPFYFLTAVATIPSMIVMVYIVRRYPPESVTPLKALNEAA
jgi:PAT family beta-lactamase induction signal transducer AmpG